MVPVLTNLLAVLLCSSSWGFSNQSYIFQGGVVSYLLPSPLLFVVGQQFCAQIGTCKLTSSIPVCCWMSGYYDIHTIFYYTHTSTSIIQNKQTICVEFFKQQRTAKARI